jgi:hypothetical protein
MSINPFPYRYIAQRAFGIIWLSSVTFLFALFYLYYIKLPIVQTICIGTAILLITGILLTNAINLLRLTRKRLLYDESEERIRRRINIRTRLLRILIVEILGLLIATATLLKWHYYQYIIPYDLVIVTCHFFPLNRIFVMPLYYLLGIILSLIGLLTMIFVPVSLQIGNQIAVIAIPSLSFIFLNWILVGYSLRDAMKYLNIF